MVERVLTVPVRYVGEKPWEMDNVTGTFTTWSQNSKLGPYLEEFPQDKIDLLMERYPGLFEVEGNLSYSVLTRVELDLVYKERFGRLPNSKWTDEKLIVRLQADDELNKGDDDEATTDEGAETVDAGSDQSAVLPDDAVQAAETVDAIVEGEVGVSESAGSGVGDPASIEPVAQAEVVQSAVVGVDADVAASDPAPADLGSEG